MGQKRTSRIEILSPLSQFTEEERELMKRPEVTCVHRDEVSPEFAHTFGEAFKAADEATSEHYKTGTLDIVPKNSDDERKLRQMARDTKRRYKVGMDEHGFHIGPFPRDYDSPIQRLAEQQARGESISQGDRLVALSGWLADVCLILALFCAVTMIVLVTLTDGMDAVKVGVIVAMFVSLGFGFVFSIIDKDLNR